MVRSVLMLGAAALLALGPVAVQAGDRYGVEPAGDEAYAYRRAGASSEGYSVERRKAACGGEARLAEDGYVYVCPNARLRVEDGDRLEAGYDRRRYEEGRYERESYDSRQSEWDWSEEGRYETASGYDRRDERWEDDHWEDERWEDGRRDGPRDCAPRQEARGRTAGTCGEIRLSDSFFWGGGGVGPEYVDAGGGGGGGAIVYAGAGASASAYASARASVGVSIRVGGKRGHGGKPGHPPGGGGGCCKGH